MSKIKIDILSARNETNSALPNARNQMNSIASGIQSKRNGIYHAVLVRNGINDQFNSINRSLNDISNKIQLFYTELNRYLDRYGYTEDQILRDADRISGNQKGTKNSSLFDSIINMILNPANTLDDVKRIIEDFIAKYKPNNTTINSLLQALKTITAINGLNLGDDFKKGMEKILSSYGIFAPGKFGIVDGAVLSSLLPFIGLISSAINPLSDYDHFWDQKTKVAQKLIRSVVGGGLVGYGVAESALTLLTSDGWKAFWDGDLESIISGSVWERYSSDKSDFLKVLSGEASASISPKYGEYENKKAKRVVKQDDLDVPWQKNNLDKEKWYDTKGTILEAKGEARIEGSVLEGHLDGDNGWAEGSVDGRVLTAEAHANAAAGLYVYEADKNGNIKRIFSPGVSAEVGASASVLELEAEGRIGLGNDKKMLGLYGEAEVDALTAEAKAKVAINKNEVYAGAKAEADLVKASASGGATVLGTDIGVNGSVKVGIGAHAEVGYTDGKFKVDVGAAVGVGFDLGFEIDTSGTVDAVCDFATSAWDGISNAWDGMSNAATDTWHRLFG